ncbi:putative phage terminase large subunit-like protein [Luteimonas cucumeris]|uniref:Putative phage terminase large subunit-like protein n=1 Tax=Luteimonas cucumeris TaxID=985012 RepID=A0A562LAW1_9GAMM|nr:terminase family protein [Luteimonas cucumeris]TWI04809.1 putative phage terminase large subunit-like protein [Luteimonas cucumeris]
MTTLQLSPQEAARELLARRNARTGLIDFTRYTFPGFEAGDHHKQIASALERVERGECRRLMIFAPPRHTKSELASRRFPAYFMGRNADKQIITCTYSGEFATDFGREVKGIVASEEYQALFPGVKLAEDSKAKGRWHTTDGGVYVAVGVGGPITGRGAHLALIDDPIKNRQDADSDVVRETVWKWYTSTLRTRLMPGGAIVLVLTRWHEDDLAGRLLAAQETGGEQWEVVTLPAISDTGHALWPEWYPLAELQAIKAAVGPRDWLALYQQQPTADDGTFFKREWFRDRYETAPEGLRTIITGDFAVTDGGGDFTELGVWGFGDGKFYALDWWSGQASADVWINALLDLVRQYKPMWFVGETGPIRRAIEPLLARTMRERRIFTAADWLSHGGADKAVNARAFQAMCAQGQVQFPETVWAERVIDQLLKFPAAKHDDAVDTCGLFGRYMDKAWNTPAAKMPQARPRRDYGFNQAPTENWKTA